MMRCASILTVLAALLLVSASFPQERGTATANKDQADESAKKVKELRKERIALLKQVRDQVTKLYQTGRVEYAQLLEAEKSLSEAELEAAESDKDRVELYKNLIAMLKEHEALAKVQFEAGRAAQATMLKAKAGRLEAEIHLEQAKMKLANAGK